MIRSVKAILHPIEILYLLGLIILQLYSSIIHERLFGGLEFLPLLLTSVYCGVGVMYGYLLAMINVCFTC